MKILSFFILIFLLSLAQAQDPPAANLAPSPQPEAPPQNPGSPPAMNVPPPPSSEPPGNVVPPANGVPSGESIEASGFAPQVPPGSEAFLYDPTNRRDPFAPEKEATQVTTEPETTSAPVVVRTLEPLENFDVQQLKVSAIIWNTPTPKAMITDPTGNTHYIKLKTRLGKKNGYVAAIREGEVVVVEFSQDNGQVVKAFKVLELR